MSERQKCRVISDLPPGGAIMAFLQLISSFPMMSVLWSSLSEPLVFKWRPETSRRRDNTKTKVNSAFYNKNAISIKLSKIWFYVLSRHFVSPVCKSTIWIWFSQTFNMLKMNIIYFTSKRAIYVCLHVELLYLNCGVCRYGSQ